MVVKRFLFSFRVSPISATTNRDTVPALPAPAQPHQNSQSCCPSTTATGSTTPSAKRKRQCPARMIPRCPRATRRRSTHSLELGGNSWDSDCESDEESCCEQDFYSEVECLLPEGHRLQKVRLPILRLARQRVRVFTANACYVAPPDHQPSLRKRPRPCNWPRETTCTPIKPVGDTNEEDTDDGFLLVSPPEEFDEKPLHFSCPFYKRDPKTYRQCLLRHDFRTFDSVITHLQRHHKKPPYCPMCSQTFDTVIKCDRHILKRTCKMGDLVMPEGLNSNQRAMLARNDRRILSNTERWNRINDVIFPDAGCVSSPYLDEGCGREISMARDYWKEYGWRCVSDVLASQDMGGETHGDDGGTRLSLFKLTLGNLLDDIMQEYETDRV
ncbi:hypothetical protein LCI18_007665 [Fusarium solani-melongenae]|uniref:Uncharacterized protein n=1 Tax=Fusarium solani subsp. cucurbitae TaxID=2747967 RepID=A0ACD3Z6J6_FUSSC|nr:hypothetical protein LCI18_007665 [Fusarium solani-melongenae]